MLKQQAKKNKRISRLVHSTYLYIQSFLTLKVYIFSGQEDHIPIKIYSAGNPAFQNAPVIVSSNSASKRASSLLTEIVQCYGLHQPGFHYYPRFLNVPLMIPAIRQQKVVQRTQCPHSQKMGYGCFLSFKGRELVTTCYWS